MKKIIIALISVAIVSNILNAQDCNTLNRVSLILHNNGTTLDEDYFNDLSIDLNGFDENTAINNIVLSIEELYEAEIQINLYYEKTDFIDIGFSRIHKFILRETVTDTPRMLIEFMLDESEVIRSIMLDKVTQYDEPSSITMKTIPQGPGETPPGIQTIPLTVHAPKVPQNDCTNNDVRNINVQEFWNDFLIFKVISTGSPPISSLQGHYTELINQPELLKGPNEFNFTCQSDLDKFLHQNVLYYLNSSIDWFIESFNDINSFEDYEIVESEYEGAFRYNYSHSSTGLAVNPEEDTNMKKYYIMNFGGIPGVDEVYGEAPDHIVRAGLIAILDRDKDKLKTIVNSNLYKSLSDAMTYLYWIDESGDSEYNKILYEFDQMINHIDITNNSIYKLSNSDLEERKQLSATLVGIYDAFTSINKEKFFKLIIPSYDLIGSIEMKDPIDQHKTIIKYIQGFSKSMYENFVISPTEYCNVLSELESRYGQHDDLHPSNKFLTTNNLEFYIKDSGAEHCPTFPDQNPSSGVCSDNDNSLEPSISQHIWKSESIWNCPPGTPECDQHTNPKYISTSPNDQNFINVRIHPVDDQANCFNPGGVLECYAILSIGSMGDNRIWGMNGIPWEIYDPCIDEYIVAGKKVGEIDLSTTVPYNIDNGIKTYKIPWTPFDPGDYTCEDLGGPFMADGATLHTCVMVVLNDDYDQVDYDQSGWDFVRENNNVAAKNMSIIKDNLKGGGSSGGEFGDGTGSSDDEDDPQKHMLWVLSPEDHSMDTSGHKTVELHLDVDEKDTTNLFENGTLRIHFSHKAIDSWETDANGQKKGSGFVFDEMDTNTITVISKDLTIEGLRVIPLTPYPIAVSYELDTNVVDTNYMNFSLVQYTEDGCIEGGEYYEIRPVKAESDTLGPREFDRKAANSAHSENGINVYPNPCQDILHLELVGESTSITKVNVYSTNSMPVFSTNIDSKSSCKLLVGHLNAGIYFIELFDGEGNRYLKKMVKIE